MDALRLSVAGRWSRDAATPRAAIPSTSIETSGLGRSRVCVLRAFAAFSSCELARSLGLREIAASLA